MIYTSKYVFCMSLICSIIIFFILNNTIFNLKINKFEFKANFVESEKISHNINDFNRNDNNVTVQNDFKEDKWSIEIHKINLKAEIAEGTTKNILDDYVGHFEDTSRDKGNICLAAHNRGYKNNYFARLKELKVGDEIIYIYNDLKKIYVVEKHEIIRDTEWDNLENTEDDRITLITCVENEPEYRRCIQGIEK